MSLRARLLLSLAAMFAIAIVVAGALIVGLTRASLVDRVDDELRATVTTRQGPLQRVADLTDVDTVAGRRLAVLRLDGQGRVLRSFPSGFSSDPDPLPDLPAYPGGIPADAYNVIAERPSVDGTIRYRVLTVQARPSLIVAVAAPLTGVEDAVRTLVRTMLMVGGVSLVALVAIAWFVIRRGLLPVERIARAAESITAGDLSHRAGVPHDRTEVGRLGAAFDTMLDELQASFEEQRAALAAKERTEGQLRRFVADASHELRTPLTAVRGYADLYAAGGLAQREELDRAMSRIGTESRRMGALVEDLLLLARLDQGRPLHRGPVDLSRLVDDAVTDARAVEPGRPIEASVAPGVVVEGDEDRLRQVVGNLLANVRVHTAAASPVEVTLWSSDGAAEVVVADHGPGIPAADAERVFDRFFRADPTRSRDRGGTGLGLSIAASIVEAHGGVLGHRPTAGGGATFIVRLPLTASSQPVPGADPASTATI